MNHLPFLLASLCFCLPTPGRAADVAQVRVEVAGKVFVGQLAPESPATQPAPPTPTTLPTTAPTTVPTALGGMAPFQVHLDAAEVIKADAIRDVRVTWDFGDPAGTYNTLDGFNAAHVYDSPGDFVVTRLLRSPAGDSTRTWNVTVTPAARRITYVSNEGDDKNDGKTPDRPVRTWDRGVLGTNGGAGEVLFRRGDRFQVTRQLRLGYDDCRLGAYGDSAKPKPVIFNFGKPDSNQMMDVHGKRFLIEDLTFDAPKTTNYEKGGTLDVVVAHGDGLVIRRVTILNVNDLVNGNGNPDGVLIQDCDEPSEVGLRSYLGWVQGSNWTFLGNRVANSTREHCIRVGGADRMNIQFNELYNLDRRKATTQPDAGDFGKAALNIQRGTVLYVANNILKGPSGVGPLGKADGLPTKEARFVGAIIENNHVTGSLTVSHGASHITYRNNYVRADDQAAFPIDGYSQSYDRTTADVRIERNTAVNAGKIGNFLTIWPGARNVALVGNAYVAPHMLVGEASSGALYVNDFSLRVFSTISGNVWPVAKSTAFARNGVMYMGSKGDQKEGFIDPARWITLPPVENDRFEKVAVNDWQRINGAGVNASKLPKTAEAGR